MNREFDIVIFGATGFSGRLIAEYLVGNYGDETRIAFAGRNEAKINALREALGVGTPALIGDSDDLEALRSIASRASLVVSCTGPFLLYGSNMVQACAEVGTDYIDVTGETYWSAQMMAAHEKTAKQSGARIISFCGFDSVPSDIGVYLLQKRAVETRGKPFSRVKMRVQSLRGTPALGGSIATVQEYAKRAESQPDILAFLADAFALCPEFDGVSQPSGREPTFDEELNSWAAPFIMHATNSKVIHRSNWQLGLPYGEDFMYDEMSSTGPGEEGKAKIQQSIESQGGFIVDEYAFDARPGDGPDKAAQEAGYYTISYYGVEDGEIAGEVTVSDNRDPGCGSTSKLVAECAMCLLRSEVTVAGGFWTPVAAMGDQLYARLLENKTLEISERL